MYEPRPIGGKKIRGLAESSPMPTEDHALLQQECTFNKVSTDSLCMAQDVLIRAEEITSSNKSGLNGPTRKVEKWIEWQPPVWV